MGARIVEKSPAQGDGPLERARSSLSRVRRIVAACSSFARAGARPEAGSRAESFRRSGLLEELGPFATQRDASLRVGEVADCTVACSPGVLLSPRQTLLRNGLKYSQRGVPRSGPARPAARGP